MDITSSVFLATISINIACSVYVVKQFVKGVLWIVKTIIKDHDREVCMCRDCVMDKDKV